MTPFRPASAVRSAPSPSRELDPQKVSPRAPAARAGAAPALRRLGAGSLGGVAVFGAAILAATACSDPLPPDPEAAVGIAKGIAEAGDFGTCPEQHGQQTFPKQGTANISLNEGTTEAVVQEMELIQGGIRCSVAGGDGSYTASIEIRNAETIGLFRLENVALQNGMSTAPASLLWNYQGSTYSGNCSMVKVDARPATADHDESFIEPGMAKLTFTCDPVLNGDNQACRATGTVFMQNCRKK